MPFSRPRNAQAVADMLPARNDFTWHAICSEPEAAKAVLSCDTWVQTDVEMVSVPSGVDPCYYKINRWMERRIKGLGEGFVHYVGFGCDDDGWPAGFWDYVLGELSKIPTMLVVNMERGNRVPGRPGSAHCSKLFAAFSNMRRYHVGLEQYFVRASLMTGEMFDERQSTADGMMAWRLARKLDDVKYANPADPSVQFNWLENGRWDE
jgi:hypothetical protein